MKNLTKFQAGLLIFFILGAIGAVAAFAIYGSVGRNSGAEGGAPVVVWGTLSATRINSVLSAFRANGRDLNITYYEVPEADFDRVLVEAIASRRGPDAIFMPETMVVRHRDKVIATPYESLSVRDFRDTYLEGTEIFMRSSGIFGRPILIDPLVLYWNRDLFTNAGIVGPPNTWNDLITLAPRLTKRDNNGDIVTSAIALGTYDNIPNAKEIISTLVLQTGNPIMQGQSDGRLLSVFDQKTSIASTPAVSALIFYTGFSDPAKQQYTWNVGLRSARDAFTAGEAALYIGFASEVEAIRARNPNLNFDTAPLPQALGAESHRTLARFYSFIPLSTANYENTASRMLTVTNADVTRALAEVLAMAPARRDLIAEPQSNPYRTITYRSALGARSWLDPNPNSSEAVFERLIENVTSGKLRVDQAVGRASDELDGLVR